MAKRIDVEGLNAWFGSFLALADVSITVEPKQVTAIIGDNYSGRDNENVYVSTSLGGATTKLNPTLSTFTSAGQP